MYLLNLKTTLVRHALVQLEAAVPVQVHLHRTESQRPVRPSPDAIRQTPMRAMMWCERKLGLNPGWRSTHTGQTATVEDVLAQRNKWGSATR